MNPSDYNPDFDPRESIENVKQSAQSAIERIEDYLFGTHQCDCGARCEPTERFVESQARICAIWHCPNCSKEFYREGVVDDEKLQPRRK